MKDPATTTSSAFFVIAVFSLLSFPQSGGPTNIPSDKPVFRAPFTLKLAVDKEHFYEEHFDRVPYVADNVVYLFVNESFGINIGLVNNEISSVTYEKDTSRADVLFRFTQEKAPTPNGPMMLLVIQSKLNRTLSMDALITRPDLKGVFKTSILPIPAGLADYESWPHPVVQLVLRNFRFSPTAPDRGSSGNTSNH